MQFIYFCVVRQDALEFFARFRNLAFHDECPLSSARSWVCALPSCLTSFQRGSPVCGGGSAGGRTRPGRCVSGRSLPHNGPHASPTKLPSETTQKTTKHRAKQAAAAQHNAISEPCGHSVLPPVKAGSPLGEGSAPPQPGTDVWPCHLPPRGNWGNRGKKPPPGRLACTRGAGGAARGGGGSWLERCGVSAPARTTGPQWVVSTGCSWGAADRPADSPGLRPARRQVAAGPVESPNALHVMARLVATRTGAGSGGGCSSQYSPWALERSTYSRLATVRSALK